MKTQSGGLSQEGLKLIACASMLLDHIGAALAPGALWLRIIGRIAFPIYCFLLVEGVHHTRHPGRYALRLAIGMVLSELPFDMLFYGGWTWSHQSVMVTLLLAFGMALVMKNTKSPLLKLLAVAAAAVLAELLRTDYAGFGILVAALFVLVRDSEFRLLLLALGLPALALLTGQADIELFYVGAVIPIAFYSGRKATASPAAQWAFYLFYPAHLAALWGVQQLMMGLWPISLL